MKINFENRGSKESERIKNIVKKYLYKSGGKFRLAIIDKNKNQKVTNNTIIVPFLTS